MPLKFGIPLPQYCGINKVRRLNCQDERLLIRICAMDFHYDVSGVDELALLLYLWTIHDTTDRIWYLLTSARPTVEQTGQKS